MAGITNNLYPPIMQTYMPAFIKTNGCRIYFALSDFNTIDEIKSNYGVQVSIKYQDSNLSALDLFKYPAEIKLGAIGVDNSKVTKNKYYIDISNADIQDTGFEIDRYYKVQLRLCSREASNPPISATSQPVSSWLVDNQDYFSEWSSICLIKPISTPQLELKYLSAASTKTYTNTTLRVTGSLSFAESDKTEYLSQYKISLFKNDGTSISNSRVIYPSREKNPNVIDFVFPIELEDRQNYFINIEIVTNNLYKKTFRCNFRTDFTRLGAFTCSLGALSIPEKGAIKVYTTSPVQTSSKYLAFRRTSNKSNFTIWEDVCFTEEGAVLNTLETGFNGVGVSMDDVWISEQENYGGIYLSDYVASKLENGWYDNTVESGTWYLYGVQPIDLDGNRGILTKMNNPVMALFESMFLGADNKQLKMDANAKVTSYKRVLNEAKVDTMGSQYPFIRRNGAINYRQLGISGTISYLVNQEYETIRFSTGAELSTGPSESYLFTTKEELYGDTGAQLYKEYNLNHNINLNNDLILEREFRNKVMDFLYADNVKLLRTASEGNLLVRLMDINLTPDSINGRYNFTANAYEIDECTLENCYKYNISSEDFRVVKDYIDFKEGV